MAEPRRRSSRASGGRPMAPETRARLGGLGVVARRGSGHMAEVGRAGQARLIDRLAAEAGIVLDDLEPADRALREEALVRAHMTRLADLRWGRA